MYIIVKKLTQFSIQETNFKLYEKEFYDHSFFNSSFILNLDYNNDQPPEPDVEI